MRRRGQVTGTLAVLMLALVFATGAAAATPQEIYRDLEDNGRLDGKYSVADLQAALAGDFRRNGREHGVRQEDGGETSSSPPVDRGNGLPFTGLDLALLTAGGGPLLLLGMALRRRLTPGHPAVRPHDVTAG